MLFQLFFLPSEHFSLIFQSEQVLSYHDFALENKLLGFHSCSVCLVTLELGLEVVFFRVTPKSKILLQFHHLWLTYFHGWENWLGWSWCTRL